DAVGQRIVVDRDEEVGIDLLGEPGPGPELHRHIGGPGHQHRGTRIGQEVPEDQGDPEIGLRLGETGGPRGAHGRMARIHDDRESVEGIPAPDLGRAADFDQKVTPVPAVSVAPDRPGKLDREANALRHLAPGETGNQRVVRSVSDPVHVTGGCEYRDLELPLALDDLEWYPLAERN